MRVDGHGVHFFPSIFVIRLSKILKQRKETFDSF